MIARIFDTPYYYALLGLLCGAVGFRLGWRLGNRFLLPVVQGLLGFLAFYVTWRVHGAALAALAVGGWALGGTLFALATFRGRTAEVDHRILRARTYRDEMLQWLRSGRGPESRPLRTARHHLWELALYLAAAAATANLLGIMMGAVLLNQMNAYVSGLLEAARRRWTVRLLAWNSWSLIRVAAYVMLGSACAAPLARVAGMPADAGQVRWLIVAGGVGVLLDLTLKLLLSRPCGRALAGAIDWDAPAAGEA